MSRSPSRDRSSARAGRTLVTAGDGGGGGGTTAPDAIAPVLASLTPTASSASSTFSGWDVSHLFDGLATEAAGQSWSASAGAPGWVQAQFSTAKTITSYDIVARTTTSNQAPTAFTLEGSANGSTGWVVVDTRSGLSWTGGESKTFTVASPGSYTYYRMNITTVGTSFPSFTEWRLYDGSTTNSLTDWFKTDSIIGLSDGAAVTPALLLDSSGHSHVVNTKSGTSVTYRATGGPAGTRPSMEFNAGALNHSTNTYTAPTGDCTYFGIVKQTSAAIGGILGAHNSGGAYVRLSATGQIELLKNQVSSVATSTLTVALNTWARWSVSYTKATGSTRFMVDSSSETITGTSGVTFTSPANLFIGSGVSGSGLQNPLAGHIFETGRYPLALGSTDQGTLMTYLASRMT